jgi:hypothetical protein
VPSSHAPPSRSWTSAAVTMAFNTKPWVSTRVLDVTMNEDQNRSRKDNGPQNIALLRRWALNACKLEGSQGSIKGKLKRAGWNDNFLAKLLTQPIQSQMR